MSKRNTVRNAVVAAMALALLPPGSALAAKAPAPTVKGYTRYFVGQEANVTRALGGGILLAGGGTDSDQAMSWLLDQGGYGDVVVLDAYGGDSYGAYLTGLGADSVETFVFSSREGAAASAVVAAVAAAEVIWIDGGDQSKYVSLWDGTALQTAVNTRVAQGAAIGGTSAGMAVLGDLVYSATNGSAQSSRVLANPYDRDVTLRRQLFDLPVLDKVITDTHFKVRDRMGRLLGFLARLEKDLAVADPRAIAVDEASALGITPAGVATVYGSGAGAWFLRTETVADANTVCRPKTALTYGPVSVQHVPAGETFDLTPWSAAPSPYRVSAISGQLVVEGQASAY